MRSRVVKRRPLDDEPCTICFNPMTHSEKAAGGIGGLGGMGGSGDGDLSGSAALSSSHSSSSASSSASAIASSDSASSSSSAPAGAVKASSSSSSSSSTSAPPPTPIEVWTPTSPLAFCQGQGGCGWNFHVDCLSRWFESRTKSLGRDQHECPRCNAHWVHEQEQVGVQRVENGGRGAGGAGLTGGAGGAGGDDGYVNLRAFQPGATQHRDTGSYSKWMGFHQHRRDVG